MIATSLSVHYHVDPHLLTPEIFGVCLFIAHHSSVLHVKTLLVGTLVVSGEAQNLKQHFRVTYRPSCHEVKPPSHRHCYPPALKTLKNLLSAFVVMDKSGAATFKHY